MSMRLHEKIRDIINASPHLTQRGLAQRMGLNPAAVNRMLYGRRNIMAEEIPVIESYLGARITPLQEDGGTGGGTIVATRGGGIEAEHNAGSRVPVYALPFPADPMGERSVVDWVPRHPIQLGVRDAFALYVVSDDMEPRYFRGELIYAHSHRPPVAGQDCIAVQKSGEVLVRRFVSSSGGVSTLEQFNPRGQKEIADRDLIAIYAVVGRS